MNGVILINKEKNISSFGVVAKVRKILNIKKVGHSGTLDPEATGLLPILVGNGTKISKYLIEHDKTYIAKLKFGIKTDTADSEGEVIKKDNFKLDKKDEKFYIEIFNSFIGKMSQFPPKYSAIKVNGKKLYEYARENKDVEIKAREVEIYSIKIISINYDENEIDFKVSCSKGTYIRTLCEDIAEKLETCGYMKELKRTRVNNFKIENSISLEELEINKNNEEYLKNKIISIENIFENKNKINLNERKKELFLNGVKLTHDLKDDIYLVYSNNVFLGLGIVQNKLLKRDVIVI